MHSTSITMDLRVWGKCPWNRILYVNHCILICIKFIKSTEIYLDKTKERFENLNVMNLLSTINSKIIGIEHFFYSMISFFNTHYFYFNRCAKWILSCILSLTHFLILIGLIGLIHFSHMESMNIKRTTKEQHKLIG